MSKLKTAIKRYESQQLKVTKMGTSAANDSGDFLKLQRMALQLNILRDIDKLESSVNHYELLITK